MQLQHYVLVRLLLLFSFVEFQHKRSHRTKPHSSSARERPASLAQQWLLKVHSTNIEKGKTKSVQCVFLLYGTFYFYAVGVASTLTLLLHAKWFGEILQYIPCLKITITAFEGSPRLRHEPPLDIDPP